MRLNPNPLPVTVTRSRHCHQIPVTFLRCFVQQWDKVFPHLSSTPINHAAFAPNWSHSKEKCTIHNYNLEGKWNLRDTRTMLVIVQVRAMSHSHNLLLETVHTQEVRHVINLWIFSLKKWKIKESLLKGTGIPCALSKGVIWVCYNIKENNNITLIHLSLLTVELVWQMAPKQWVKLGSTFVHLKDTTTSSTLIWKGKPMLANQCLSMLAFSYFAFQENQTTPANVMNRNSNVSSILPSGLPESLFLKLKQFAAQIWPCDPLKTNTYTDGLCQSVVTETLQKPSCK